ncbi:hypothetical protein AVEN_184107-1 [Araneus ventricosus]|uniref:DUF4817 domain-containing protein n=1 Tax=Araneus ventricosus TaxID=182803 RepID=A0A4Y2D0B1_ARAVE|nr:hypothetical protein AVEN_184107-1 [Araneus ventricosus]
MFCYGALNLLQPEIPKASNKMATLQQKARLLFHENKSIITVQRRFRLEYQNYQSPNVMATTVILATKYEDRQEMFTDKVNDHMNVMIIRWDDREQSPGQKTPTQMFIQRLPKYVKIT